MTSCEKAEATTPPPTKCPDPTYPITGLWEGTYRTDQVSHAATYVSFAIYPDGTMLRRSKHSTANEYALFRGRWKLTGNQFEYRDTAILYSGGTIVDIGTATFSNTGDLTNASWQDISGQSYTGTFQNMKRIN